LWGVIVTLHADPRSGAGRPCQLAALFAELDALRYERLARRFVTPASTTRSHDHVLGLVQAPTGAPLLAEAHGDVVGFVHLALREAPELQMFVPRRVAAAPVGQCSSTCKRASRLGETAGPP
jgi:hypothetical protein